VTADGVGNLPLRPADQGRQLALGQTASAIGKGGTGKTTSYTHSVRICRV
jgi:hypothetical protein